MIVLIRSLEESDSWRWKDRLPGLEEGLIFNGDRVSVWEDEKVLDMNDDHGCITM